MYWQQQKKFSVETSDWEQQTLLYPTVRTVHSPTRSMTRTWSPRMLSVIGMICS